MVRAYLRRCGTELRSVTEPIDNTPIGRAMEGVLSVFAEFDNNVRTERSRQGMMERVRQGVWVWPAPLGYYRPQVKANLVPDPKRAPLIRLAFEEFSTGTYTYARLAARLNELGLRTRYGQPLTPSAVHKMLVKPVYTGTIRVGGEEFVGAFEPLVSRDLFRACQPAHFRPASPLADPRSLNNPLFPLRGLVRCAECGKRLTGSSSTGSKGGRYAYYHHHQPRCPRAHSIPKNRFENAFREFVERYTIRPNVAEALRRILQEEVGGIKAKVAQVQARIRKELTELEAARQRVFELHRSGVYTDEEFHEQKSMVDERIKQKHLSLTDRDEGSINFDDGLERCFEMLRNPARTWDELGQDFGKQLRFQHLLVPTGLTYDGEQFGTQEMSLIYTLKEEIQGDKFRLEPLLTHRWNELLSELKQWAELFRG
jgi:site-specific DNA recombinase